MSLKINNQQHSLLKLGLVGIAVGTSIGLATIANAESYTVQAGDTLSAIANRYQKNISDLASLNGITNVNIITVGQELQIDTATKMPDNSQLQESKTETTPAVTGLSSSDVAAKEEIAQRESSGSYTAQNGQYYGRYQLTLSYLNGDLSPENQERVADEYVASRYGSWSAALAFWNANGWY